MTSIYLLKDDKVLLLFRKGGRVVSDVWTGSAGGHFEEFELNDAKACVLREMNEELGLCEDNIRNLSLRYVTLRRTKGEISNGEVTDMYCSCPYALDGRNCKHMAAVLYEWSENEAEEKKDEENAINTDLFQPAYTVNSHKKKLTAVEGLVSGVVERVQK